MDVLRFPWMRDLIRRDDGSNRVPGHVRHVGGDRPGRGPPISLGSAPYVGRGVKEARAFEAAHRETGFAMRLGGARSPLDGNITTRNGACLNTTIERSSSSSFSTALKRACPGSRS